MTLFNIQTKYLTLKSKYDFSSRSKTWLSDSFKIPFMKQPSSVPQSTHFKEGLRFLLMLTVQLLRTSPVWE